MVHGTITESTLKKSLLDRNISLEDPVSKIMEPPLPSVPADPLPLHAYSTHLAESHRIFEQAGWL